MLLRQSVPNHKFTQRREDEVAEIIVGASWVKWLWQCSNDLLRSDPKIVGEVAFKARSDVNDAGFQLQLRKLLHCVANKARFIKAAVCRVEPIRQILNSFCIE